MESRQGRASGESVAPSELWARARAFAIDTVRVDARSLAIFRIGLGLLLVADVLLRSRNFHFFYTERGVVPQSLAQAASPDNAVSVFYLTTNEYAYAALFALGVVLGLWLVVGYRTRIATVLAFLFVISLDHHNPLVLSYADVLYRLLLFLAIFLPLGERWSIDAAHRDRPPRRSVAGVATALVLGQLVYMYAVNGLHKTQEALWLSGDATPLIMGLDNTTFLLGELTREVPTLLQLGGLVWFFLLLYGWILLVARGWPRAIVAGLLIGGHASFALTVRIGAFPYVPIAALVLFVQPRVWDDLQGLAKHLGADFGRIKRHTADLGQLARRIPDPRIAPDLQARVNGIAYYLVLGIVAGLFLLMAVGTFGQALGIVENPIGPQDEVEDVAETIGVDQPDWTVFAPTPRTTDRYYVFPARTADGEVIDVYHNRPMTYERPHDGELQRQFDTYRERFYMNSVRRGGFDSPVTERLGEHICESYHEEHGVELTHVNMRYVFEDVTLETIDDPEDRDRSQDLIYAHGCGDKEPIEIEPP